MERMQMEVRAVAGINNCFVSLPLHLLQALQSTSASPLPPLLALELRSGDNRWPVAWAGSTSSSSAIEIAQIFADSVSLPDSTNVQVRVLPNVPKATLVTVEPETEDDWEVLELNAELAEAALLNQVRIVHETMKFPLWLHDRTVITFVVVSTIPSKGVVQLVPGTEVAVAPKRRKRNPSTHDVFDTPLSNRGEQTGKALLRVQDADRSVSHETSVKGFAIRVVPTTVVYIHPDTANKCSLQSLHLVSISPRFLPKVNLKNMESEAFKFKSSEAAKVASNNTIEGKKESRQAIVRLLVSNSVAKGHLMMSQSLRLYLRVGLHSWVYLKACNVKLKEETPLLSLSPCRFQTSAKDKNLESDAEVFESRRNLKTKNLLPEAGLSTYTDVIDRSVHDDIIASLSSETVRVVEQDTAHQSENRKGLECLLDLWASAEQDAIFSAAGVAVNSLVLGNETLLHFEVRRFISNDYVNVHASTNGPLDNENNNKKKGLAVEILFALVIPDDSVGEKFSAYELPLDKGVKNENKGSVDFMAIKFSLGDPISFYSIKERNSAKGVSPDVSSLSWMGPAVSDVIKRMAVLLSPAAGMLFDYYSLPLPGHVLIYGPPGSGKTVLARAAAKYLEKDKGLLAHVIFVSCSALALEKVQAIRPALADVIFEALERAPSIIILDDLDSIISSSSSDSEASQSSAMVISLTKFLTDIIDEYREKRKSTCGIGPIAFIASVRSLDTIPQPLCSSGRFDFHVQLAAPATTERWAILKHEIKKRSLECSDDILQDVASKCEGYDAYDLEILVDRSVHAAVGRILPSKSRAEKHITHALVREDFSQAMHEFVPVAMRDITKSAAEGGRSGWEDVGGLTEIRNAIEEMIELPSKYPNIFAKAPLRLRSNVLLYGPPGCGKTHIVGAAAAACSLRFISVKGPELLNKYIGASEQAVRDIFSKAAAAAPCLLFFDEFDSIAPKRGHDNTGVTDRVVNQFLTELDGVEVLTGVFVFAATSRPDLLDAALLRPGRLDRLLFCDFPSPHDRFDILTVLSRKLPMANDVDLEAIAQMTEGFSGADLQALLSDAQLDAVHEFLNIEEERRESGGMPVITDPLLKSIASKARPSVSETEKQRLYDIYSQFLNSKRSASAQSRDAKGKGKKATLA